MNDLSLVELLLRCQAREPCDNDAWAELLRRWRSAVRGVYVRCGGHTNRLDDFETWFGTWLYREPHRLNGLLRAVENTEPTDPDRREARARDYLRRVLATGINEFESECRWRGHTILEGEHEAPSPEDYLEIADCNAQEVRAAAAQIPNQDVRIAFWLRYIRVCGDPLPDDMDVLRSHNPKVEQRLQTGVAEAIEAKHMHAFDYAEIADLLGMNADPSNRYDVLTQRVRRGLLHVQGRLGVVNTHQTEDEP